MRRLLVIEDQLTEGSGRNLWPFCNSLLITLTASMFMLNKRISRKAKRMRAENITRSVIDICQCHVVSYINVIT